MVEIPKAAERFAPREVLKAIAQAIEERFPDSAFLFTIEGKRLLIAAVYVEARPPYAKIAKAQLELEALVGALSEGMLRGEAQIRVKDPLGRANEEKARIDVYARKVEQEWWERGRLL